MSSQAIIILIIAFIATAILTPLIILQISDVSILLVTFLLFVLLQQIRFPFTVKLSSSYDSFPRIISQPIYKLKSLLFIKEPSTNINSFVRERSKGIYIIPLYIFFVYYLSLLFNSEIFLSSRSQCCAIIKRSNKAFS